MICFWFILGAAVGSFLNVVIYRLPRKKSVVFPASHCPACGTNLSPLDLVPLFSFLFLRGKCRYCGDKISLRYPLVELLTAASFSFAWAFAGGETLSFIFQVIFISLLIVLFFVDLEQQVIPDVISIPGIFAGLIYNFLRGNWASSLAGMFIGYFLLYAIRKIGKILYKKEVMGEGDPYAAAFLGAGLGWSGALVAIFLSYLLAAAASIVLLLSGRAKMGQAIPFGPALAAGGMIALFFGERILAWYLGTFL